jgi:hypothetical protein
VHEAQLDAAASRIAEQASQKADCAAGAADCEIQTRAACAPEASVSQTLFVREFSGPRAPQTVIMGALEMSNVCVCVYPALFFSSLFITRATGTLVSTKLGLIASLTRPMAGS